MERVIRSKHSCGQSRNFEVNLDRIRNLKNCKKDKTGLMKNEDGPIGGLCIVFQVLHVLGELLFVWVFALISVFVSTNVHQFCHYK